jgi:HTH-type transcriptional regulator/antitoxin HipB
MTTIIDQLKAVRQALGMKQSELGKKLGLPQSHISKLERDTANPRLSTVVDMARVMDQELMLIPRQLVPHIAALLRGDDGRERKWQLDEEEEK